MSHRYTVKSVLRASANGRHSHDDHGVPWQNTTAGPDPARPHAIRRPSHANVSPRSTPGTLLVAPMPTGLITRSSVPAGGAAVPSWHASVTRVYAAARSHMSTRHR